MNLRKVLFLVLACAWLVPDSSAQSTRVFNIRKDWMANRVSRWRVNASLVGSSLQAQFTTLSAYPSVAIRPATALDLREYDAFLISVENLDPSPVTVYVRLDDRLDANGAVGSRTGWAVIEPGRRRLLSFPLRINPADYGMRGLPGLGAVSWLTMTASAINIANIVRYHVFLTNPTQNRNLVIGSPYVARQVGSLNNLVDRFGQYNYETWVGKVVSDSHLIQLDAEEEANLSAFPQLEDRNNFGAWTGGLNYTATGRFRIHKENNKYWFISPDGYPYLSFGINAVGGSDPTIITGREYMFSELPDRNGPYAGHWGRISDQVPNPPVDGDTFNFFNANLQRKWGDQWRQRHDERSLDRLISWGFNTLGQWTQENLYTARRIPYTTGIVIPKEGHTSVAADPNRDPMPDPFDPSFRDVVRAELEPIANYALNDPWCVGWFLDNEPNFVGGTEEGGRYGVAHAVLQRTIFDCPAKVEFLADLQVKYPTIHDLNIAWNTNFASWEIFAFNVTVPDTDGTAARKEDFRLFCLKFAREYYRVLDEELARLDPQALNLGTRWYRHSQEFREAAAQYCDVLSVNIYATTIPASFSAYAYLNRPFMSTEFHFGSLDRGMFHPGLAPPTATQNDRAAAFKTYVRSIVDNPLFVGCHWMQFADQPVTGRVINGENYAIGWANVADTTYWEMVKAAREMLEEAYPRRHNL